jgi:hypothetical protein
MREILLTKNPTIFALFIIVDRYGEMHETQTNCLSQ